SLPQLVMSRWINPTDMVEILHCAPGWLDGKSPALALRTYSLARGPEDDWKSSCWVGLCSRLAIGTRLGPVCSL
ncbi:hypothetical protein EV122DRAFT_259387, partial [Schizophyllum commune]